MSRRLATVAAAALAISAISFAVAVWIGDTTLLDIGGPRGAMRGIACAAARFIGGGGAPSSSRSETTALAWPGGGAVEINLPATLLYHPPPLPPPSLTGPP